MTEPLLAIDVEGAARPQPLVPSVLYVEGHAARELASRLAQRVGAVEDAIDPRLLGVSARDASYLVLTGPNEALPWIDGARYFGIDPDAPRLRLSTTHAPTMSGGAPLAASLLERALIAKLAGAGSMGPFVVMRARVIPLGLARPLDRGLLETFARSSRSNAEPSA